MDSGNVMRSFRAVCRNAKTLGLFSRARVPELDFGRNLAEESRFLQAPRGGFWQEFG